MTANSIRQCFNIAYYCPPPEFDEVSAGMQSRSRSVGRLCFQLDSRSAAAGQPCVHAARGNSSVDLADGLNKTSPVRCGSTVHL
eukprot:COSAG01_NODE_1874_length_9000_cov_4.914616_2_plen_84_part_00